MAELCELGEGMLENVSLLFHGHRSWVLEASFSLIVRAMEMVRHELHASTREGR
jgi:hypothetical protein